MLEVVWFSQIVNIRRKYKEKKKGTIHKITWFIELSYVCGCSKLISIVTIDDELQ